MARYTNYLAISVNHRYFEDSGKTIPIEVKPTDTTAHWLQQYHMFLKPTSSGICIIADLDMLESIPPPDEPVNLIFKIFSGDVFFRNYTEIPVNRELCFALFEFNDYRSSAQIASPKHWLNSQDIFDSNYRHSISEFELSHKLVGVVNIELSRSHFYDKNKSYTLDFPNISAFWQYYVPTINPISDYQILDKTGKYNFENIGEEMLSNRRYVIYRSSIALPVTLRSDLSFQLRNNHKIVYRRLANATPEHIEITQIDEEKHRLCHIYLP
ncbi:hypothetical protein [Vibrio hangzhouensis]|uniref:Uncharacterized protein n=1 Tax=Vibrio hangzhouensis TaxID=462991 RepID=A0A1H5RZ52_9VIBR|nr:hypothetical protein [Vibrio hangzhouensis]SEF43642.1 hypothetical protein SAMN04488244_101184 [Vibrio hangzhouensis]